MKFRTFCIVVVLAFACVLLGGCAQAKSGDANTLFICLCGSDLETKQGLAGKNIDELLAADIPTDTRVIIQTGSSRTWRSHGISNNKLQRYEVRNKQLQLLEELDNASMGNEGTLRDFLSWGAQNYGSKKNVLVIWDHGGKSADRVCFDENYDLDALDRSELVAAFKDAKLSFTFDLVIFDACFMSTLENAAIVSDYARYLVASQEVVPSSGLDYGALARDMSTLDAKDLGVSICDAYVKKCVAKNKGDTAELSLMDLSQTDKMVRLIDATCNQLASILEARDGTFKLVSTTKTSAIYGTKSPTNLFDLQNFLYAIEYFDSSLNTEKNTTETDSFVIYSQAGDKSDATGISLYFPFTYDRKEFQSYVATCPIKGYAELLKRTYDNLPARMINFKDRESVSADGDFRIALTPGSGRYLTSVTYTLFRQNPQNPESYILMGSDCNIKQDWDNLTFCSDFYPTWPSLWGEHILTSVYFMIPHVVAFSAPVCAEGENTELIAVYTFDDNYRNGSYADCALWGGIDSNGVPTRDYEILEAGDEIAAYAATDVNRENLVLQETVIIPDGVSDKEANQVVETPLEDGRYRLQFCVTDALGNTFTSDYGVFEVAGGQSRLVEVQPA